MDLLKVLLIDDEEAIRISLRAFLEDYGYEVFSADGGQQGIDKFYSLKPDIVITDLRMPEVGGLEVIEKITEANEEIPIVVVSGTGIIQDSIDAIRKGAWDYISKPIVDLDELKHILDRVLERAKLIAANRNYKEHLEEEVEKRTADLQKELKRREEAENTVRDTLRELQGLNSRLREEEENLRRAWGETNKANRAKSEFLANMSHELKTPLNAILGFSTLLLESKLDIVQKKYIETINESGQILLTLIGDLLDTVHIMSGELKLNINRFDLVAMVERIRNIVPHLNDHKVKFNYIYNGPEQTFFEGDAIRISQILLNLIDNAFKYTKDGQVSLQIDIEDQYETKQCDEFCDISIIVSDSGCGVAAPEQDKIFDTFYQLDSSHTRQFGGSGIGLPIVQQLAKIMGGDVSLVSHEGEGSEFTVSIKLKKAASSEEEVSVRGESWTRLPQTDVHLLLVEDNCINALMMSEALTKRGAVIDTAVNGVKAIEKLKENHYDVVLMDVMMPIMGGLEATRIIRNELHQDVPIIGVSAASLQEDVDEGLAAGMNEYLSKPVDFDQLTEVLAGYLNNKKSGA